MHGARDFCLIMTWLTNSSLCRVIICVSTLIATSAGTAAKTSAPAAASAARKPNIIFILSDDLGYGDVGCYGQKRIKTPNIDRMASEGLRFTQGYAGATVCAPSRCVLMTGLHNG